MGDLQPLMVILDDNEPKQLLGAAEELKKRGKEVVEAEEPEEVDDDVEELPSWLPDGWIIEVCRGDNGSTRRYYTSPVSGYTFSTKMETLNYLFSEMDERVLESQACAEDIELNRKHAWLPDGWVIEVRAGGKKMDKMYKFYVHMPTGKRFFSKEDVLRYVNEGEISRCDVKGLCDTSSEDNMLAQVEFNPDGLPEGWVKEIIYRKCNDGIRKDPYYTDPVSQRVFRTLKSAMSYLKTGEMTKHAYIPRRRVTDMYSFDKCTDLPESMLKRLNTQGKTKRKSVRASAKLPNEDMSNHSEGGHGTSNLRAEPKEKKCETMQVTSKEPISSDSESIKRSRGRPQKILRQANKNISNRAKSLCNEARTVGKNEKAIGGEHMSKESTSDGTENCALVIQEAENSVIGRSQSPGKREKLGLMTDADLHEQESGKFNVAGEKLTCFSVHKFYMRRNSKHTLGLKRE